jgi:hypothetical protein
MLEQAFGVDDVVRLTSLVKQGADLRSAFVHTTTSRVSEPAKLPTAVR